MRMELLKEGAESMSIVCPSVNVHDKIGDVFLVWRFFKLHHDIKRLLLS